MIKLLSTRVSSECLYPRDEIFVECTFEAENDSPITESVDLFCDFVFGHMTIPANRAKNYTVKTRMYPQPALWKKGDIVTVGTRWQIPAFTYGGSFGLNIGICNGEAVPVDFAADGKTVKRKYVGDIQLSFGGCAPKFVNSHRRELVFEIEPPEIKNKNPDSGLALKIAEVNVRDRKTDSVICEMLTSENGCYSNAYTSFEIKTSEENGLTAVTLENVCESDGFELLDVKFPTALAKKRSKMITTYMGGRKFDCENAFAWGYEQKYDHRNAAVIESEDGCTVTDAPFLDDKLHHSVYEMNGERFCAAGVTFTYRVRAFGELESIKVINIPTLYIYEAKDFSEVLLYLRKDLKKKTHMYDGALFYYFQIECDGFDEVRTFKEALQRVKELHELTGGVKQVMLLRGWQHEGHDTGYPDVFTVNKKAGTLEDLKYLIEEAKKYNAIVTFHDNYDDMYEENGYFDRELAAMNERGGLLRSWIWVSGISVLTSFPKLIKSGKMSERVKKTLAMYPVHDSYHLDVLSCEVKRYDFSPKIHMAAQEVLEYKKAVVREFEKYGFTVTSEAVSQPFAGVIGHAWSIGYSRAEKLFSHDEPFPLMPMIYHGYVPYSGGNCVEGITSGATIVPGITGELGNYKEIYYLRTLPILRLCNCTIDRYGHKDGIYTTTYSNGTVIAYDEKKDDIEIRNNDRYQVKDSNLLTEGYSKGEYIGYTKYGSYKMKKYFNGEIEKITEIGNGSGEIPYSVRGGYICIDTAENTAFIINVK